MPENCSGISHPLNSANLAPSAAWRSYRGSAHGSSRRHSTVGRHSIAPEADIDRQESRDHHRTVAADPTAIAADAVVIGMRRPPRAVRVLAEADRVDGAVGGSLAVMLKALGATGKRDEVTKVARQRPRLPLSSQSEWGR